MSLGIAVVLCDDTYEDLELHYPRLRLEEAGFEVRVAGLEKGRTYNGKHGYQCVSTCVFQDIDPLTVRVLIVPGGFAPDKLRRYESCLKLVAAVHANGGVVGHICHGAWVPISAKILRGVKTTCFYAIKDDVINAGADYSTDKCVVDAKARVVSAQTPNDLPSFMKAVLALAAERAVPAAAM